MKQLSHYQIQNQQKKFPITIVCDALRTPENIGMCFRVADSFGVQKIYLSTNSPEITNIKIQKTARNTIQNSDFEYYEDFNQLIAKLKSENKLIVGLEITDTSIAIQEFEPKASQEIVLIMGSERTGIEQLDLLDTAIHVPMYGKNSSMNVVHCLSICLYDLTTKFNRLHK